MGSVTPGFELRQTQMHRLSASETVTMLRKGHLTVSDYAERLLSRVSERNDTVNAWAYLDPHLVMEQAKRLDAIPANERGPLHGVAVGIKDVLTTRGRLWIRGRPLLLMTKHRYADAIWLAHLSRWQTHVSGRHSCPHPALSRCPDLWQDQHHRVRRHTPRRKLQESAQHRPHPRRFIFRFSSCSC